MTKLMEWLVVLGTTFFLWLGLLTNKLDNNFAKQYPDLLLWSPVIFVLLFGVSSQNCVNFLVFQKKILVVRSFNGVVQNFNVQQLRRGSYGTAKSKCVIG